MYISRVEIDRYNRRRVRDLTHVGAYHAWVEESFPSELEQSIPYKKIIGESIVFKVRLSYYCK